MKNKKYIALHYDLIYKHIFGTNKNIKYTIDMLEKLLELPSGSLEGSTIRNSVVLDKERVKNKDFSLDIILETPSGAIFNLEMQKHYDKNAEIKNFMYVTKLFSTQLKVGDDYKLVKKVSQINFVKDLDVHNNKNGKIIKRYYVTEEDDLTDRIMEDVFSVMVIDIDKKCENDYNGTIKEFESWRRLMGADKLEEAKKVSESPLIKEALEEMVNFMNNDYVQDYSATEKLRECQLETAKEESYAKGKSDGLEQGSIDKSYEIAKRMLKSNKSLEEISLFTEISIEELENLKNEINNEE